VQPGKQPTKLESTKKEENGRSESRTFADCGETSKYYHSWLMLLCNNVIIADLVHANGTMAHGPSPQSG
jgi:hypothetical protein